MSQLAAASHPGDRQQHFHVYLFNLITFISLSRSEKMFAAFAVRLESASADERLSRWQVIAQLFSDTFSAQMKQ